MVRTPTAQGPLSRNCSGPEGIRTVVVTGGWVVVGGCCVTVSSACATVSFAFEHETTTQNTEIIRKIFFIVLI